MNNSATKSYSDNSFFGIENMYASYVIGLVIYSITE